MKSLSILSLCLLASVGHAEDVGFRIDLGGANQVGVPDRIYTPIRFSHLAYNTMPAGSVVITPGVDFTFVAPADGLVHFGGQVWVIIDPTQVPPSNGSYDVQVFKNTTCAVVNLMPAGIGGGSALMWWAVSIPLQTDDLAKKGDVYKWCLYSSASGSPPGTTYIDGHPAHTRLDVWMNVPMP